MKKNTPIQRRIRVALACVFFFGLTIMLCDVTGVTHKYLSWMARVQFLPAVLSLTAGFSLAALAWVGFTLLLTLLFGRIYCSTICPLGVMQDGFRRLGNLLPRKWRQSQRPTNARVQAYVRALVLFIFIVLSCLTLTAPLAHLIAPYSAFARMVQTLLAPLAGLVNNLLASAAAHYESYAFYPVEVWTRAGLSVGIALTTLLLIGGLAAWKGRWWCNTICPVGTVLGGVSRFALFRVEVDKDACIGCGLCQKKCKAECIDVENHRVDMSRCVDCFDCLDVCRHNAIHYRRASVKEEAAEPQNDSRRKFLTLTGAMAVAAGVKAQHAKTDGGLAIIEDKQVPKRTRPVLPAGSYSVRHLAQYCTSCQLCISACPQHILRPSTSLTRLMQPEMDFTAGYCLTSCTRCADVCPTDAIRPIQKEEKTAIQIGCAYWLKKNCIMHTDGVHCGNCVRHCPSGALSLVEGQIVVDGERCIGCGHCEYVCPARPFSAIYVEGLEQQMIH